ncbi:hypothetical protein E4U61_000275, partial [Claviceps capensis]
GGEGENIGHWLKRLRSSYLRANDGRDVGPSQLIQAIDSALCGEASEFVCENPLLDQIVDQADDCTATQDDLVTFENALRDRFDVKTEVGSAYDDPFPNVVQGDGESLDAYHGRVLSVFRARGGRDKPVSPDQPPLTLFEVTGVNEWIHRFVLGLHDKVLLAESINQSALSSDSLRSALQIVKKASSLLEVKSQMARSMAQQARLGLIDGWFRQQLGHSANEELSRAYGLPSSLFDQAAPNYYQPDQAYFPPVPQQRYAYWPQQENAFHVPVPAPVFAPAAVPAPTPAPAPVFAPAPVPVPVRARYATVDFSDLCPPMEHEETEVVAPEPIEDECPAFEAVDVPYAVTELAPAPIHARVEFSELCFADEHEKAQVAPVERVGDLCPIFEAVDVSHAAVGLGVKPLPPQHDEHEDAG